ncbi:MAG: amino acid ABC transporter ATP-binding protein [Nitrososphaerota archaeon]|nr:amino acid ABC transporter ATP-binding protein [Candidatus Calditenuaceae archaeon]MDW8073568.1 amino acid ABC transporter ATP-binding protein [Nitrososphaerota archaeon]
MSSELLSIRGLKAGYGSVEVLRGIDLDVVRGEKIVILGPSGSGKSTLLKCIPYLVRPWSGEIRVDGLVVKSDPATLRSVRVSTGFVFQQYNLFPHMTIIRNVALPLELNRGMSRREAEKTALSVLTLLGLGDLAGKYPLELSGGQQQRAAIARALAIDPKLLLLDEPTSALDPELRYEVVETLYQVAKQGRSMLIVTHELDFAEAAADRVVFIDEGLIVEEGDARDVLERPRKERTERFLRRLRSRVGEPHSSN